MSAAGGSGMQQLGGGVDFEAEGLGRVLKADVVAHVITLNDGTYVSRYTAAYVASLRRTLVVGDSIRFLANGCDAPQMGLIVGFSVQRTMSEDSQVQEDFKVDTVRYYRYSDISESVRGRMTAGLDNTKWTTDDLVALGSNQGALCTVDLRHIVKYQSITFDPAVDLSLDEQQSRFVRCVHLWDPIKGTLNPMVKFKAGFEKLLMSKLVLPLILERNPDLVPSKREGDFARKSGEGFKARRTLDPTWGTSKDSSGLNPRMHRAATTIAANRAMPPPLPLVYATFDILNPATWTPSSAAINVPL